MCSVFVIVGDVIGNKSLQMRLIQGNNVVEQLAAAVPTKNSIALKKREQHSRGNEFLGLRKHLSNRRVVYDVPYRLPGAEDHRGRGLCIYQGDTIAQAARRSYRW